MTCELVIPTFNSYGYINNLNSRDQYILVNKRSGTPIAATATRLNEGTSISNVGGETITFTYREGDAVTEIGNATVWKYGYDYPLLSNSYFTTGNTQYLTFGNGNGGLNSNKAYTIIKDAGDNTVYLGQTTGNTTYYLNDYSGHTGSVFNGWNNQDEGSVFYIYKKAGTTSSSEEIPNTITYTYAGHNHFNKGSGNKANGDLIWTGLAANHLDENENIVFPNHPEGGIFSYDPSKISSENGYFDGVKNVYEFVGMPFVLTKDGHYTFDSDQNGVYFKDTDGDTYNNPAPGTSREAPNNLQFDYGVPQPLRQTGGVADKSTNGWFPYNIYTTRTENGVTKTEYGMKDPEQYNDPNVDYHFGMRADLPLSMTANGRVKSTDDTSPEITFRFSGDDDVWIYIDGQHVVDLGGMHNRLDIEIDFAKNTVTYSEHTEADTNDDTGSYNDPDNWKAVRKLFKENAGDTDSLLPYTRYQFAANENHELQFFYLERGCGTSNCRVEFNLPMTDTVSVTKVANESWSAEADEADGDANDGTYPLTKEEQANVDQILFGFTLYKKVAGATTFEPVRSTNYYLVDADGNSILDSEGNPIVDNTDENGHFYLKNGQTAKFMTEIPMTGVSYYVVEDKTPDGFLTPDFQFKGTATNGFDWYDADGVKQKPIRDASVILEQEIPMPEEQEDGTLVWPEENKSYTITVYTVDELPYGTYTVLVTVAKKGTKAAGPVHSDGFKRSMHEFYLDGIRVMQPLDGVYRNRKDMQPDEYGTISGLFPIPDKDRTPITNKALDAYTTDNESNLDIVTLRTKLITDVLDNKVVWDGINFVVLTDTNEQVIDADEYTSNGPKEEVYLKPGQKVRFSLKYWEPEGLSLYIGMKAPFGNGATVNVGNTPYSIGNATDCYRDVTKSYAYQELIDPKDGSQPYYVITYTFEVPETASEVVALTNIKVVGSHEFTILENEEVYQ